MPFTFEPLPAFGPLRQGELLSGLWELKPNHPPVQIQTGNEVQVIPIPHPVVVVMTAGCDLEQDFRFRFPDEPIPGAPASITETRVEAHVQLSHVWLCDVFDEPTLRKKNAMNSDQWRRIQSSQLERYHRLMSSQTTDAGDQVITNQYLDFKQVFGVSPDMLYQGLRDGRIARLGLVPPTYVHDLIHRFYGYLSRVSLPEW